MEIKEFEDYLTGNLSYNIYVRWDDDIIPEELAECFLKQYPNTRAVLAFSKIEKLNVGILLLGLKLNKSKRRKNADRKVKVKKSNTR